MKGITVRLKEENGDWETVEDARWNEHLNGGEFFRMCANEWLKENGYDEIQIEYQ